jgi:hypothetical protein
LNHLFPLTLIRSCWLQGTRQVMVDSSERRGSLVWCHWSHGICEGEQTHAIVRREGRRLRCNLAEWVMLCERGTEQDRTDELHPEPNRMESELIPASVRCSAQVRTIALTRKRGVEEKGRTRNKAGGAGRGSSG